MQEFGSISEHVAEQGVNERPKVLQFLKISKNYLAIIVASLFQNQLKH